MAKKKDESKVDSKTKKEKDLEKAEKKKARLEAIKNRPAGQRPNSKQVDIIEINDKSHVMNFGYPLKNKEGYQGVIITSVLMVEGTPVSTSVSFVNGSFTVKSKKGHGTISTPKSKKDKEESEETED